MDPAPMLTNGAAGVHPLHAVRRLQSIGGALLTQALLQGQLARIEWQEEKQYLVQMLAITLLGFACVLCMMLFAGALVLTAAWETPYRIRAVAGLILLYGLGAVALWRRLQALTARSERNFAALREELAADAAVLKAGL